MPYTLTITPRGLRQLERVPRQDLPAVITAIQGLAAVPRPPGCLQLRGRLVGWRIRVGRFRVVYEIDDTPRTVTVTDVDHRRDVYR
jgi:mRNA interferase RelE/StbE